MYDTTSELINLNRLLGFFRAMPRVVADQRGKFDNDDFFKSLSRNHEVRYSGSPHAKEDERRKTLISDCDNGHIPITFPWCGLNLELRITAERTNGIASSSTATTSTAPTGESLDYARFHADSPDIEISSRLILNGVCVRWRGTINQQTLVGNGCLEFDEETAQSEEHQIREMQLSMDVVRQLGHQIAATAVTHRPPSFPLVVGSGVLPVCTSQEILAASIVVDSQATSSASSTSALLLQPPPTSAE